jgi:hypothetical protein
VLERVVLGLDQNVEARHGLEQRRVSVGDALDVGGGQMETDRDRILSLVKKLTG